MYIVWGVQKEKEIVWFYLIHLGISMVFITLAAYISAKNIQC
jgi:cytoskeletal protein RodZ